MATRGAATRAKLLKATTEVINQVGYARATTRLIADAAGVAEGSIYRHFPDKQQLFLAAVLDGNSDVLERMNRLPALAGDGTVRQNLTELVSRLARLRTELLPLELAMLADPDLRSERLRAWQAMRGQAAGPDTLIADYLRAEQALGRVRAEVDVDRAATVLLATMFGLAVMPHSADPDEYDALVGEALDLIVTGLSTAAA